MENITKIDELESESKCNQDTVVSDVQAAYNALSIEHPAVENKNLFIKDTSTKEVLTTVDCAAPVEEKDSRSTSAAADKNFAQESNIDLINQLVKCALVPNPNDTDHLNKSDTTEVVDVASRLDLNTTSLTKLDALKTVDFTPPANPSIISDTKVDSVEMVSNLLANLNTINVAKSDIVETVEFTLANSSNIKSDTAETIKFASGISDTTGKGELASVSNPSVDDRVTQLETVKSVEFGSLVNQNNANSVIKLETVVSGSTLIQNDTKNESKSEIAETASVVCHDNTTSETKLEIVEIESAVLQNDTKSATKSGIIAIESAVNQNDTMSATRSQNVESESAENQNDTTSVTRSEMVDIKSAVNQNNTKSEPKTNVEIELAVNQNDTTSVTRSEMVDIKSAVNQNDTKSETKTNVEIELAVNQNDTKSATKLEPVDIESVINRNNANSVTKLNICETAVVASAVNQDDAKSATKLERVDIESAINRNNANSVTKLNICETAVVASAVNQDDAKSATKLEPVDIEFAINRNNANSVTKLNICETAVVASAVNQDDAKSVTKSENIETGLKAKQTDANSIMKSDAVEAVKIAPTANLTDTNSDNLVLGASETIKAVASSSTVKSDNSGSITKSDVVESIDSTANQGQTDHPSQDDSYDSASVAGKRATSAQDEIMSEEISFDSDLENVIGNDTDKEYLSESESDNVSIKSDNSGNNADKLQSDKNEALKLDDDEDKRKPQYIPRRGDFFGHDDRWEEANAPEEEVDTESVKKEKKVIVNKRENKLPEGRWQHDKFDERQQTCKTSDELVESYGYNIREDEAAPKSRRRNKYKRGVTKYDRKSDDVGAYVKRNPKWRGPMRPGKPEPPRYEAPEQLLPADDSNPTISQQTIDTNDRHPTKNAKLLEQRASGYNAGSIHRDNGFSGAPINFRGKPRHLQRGSQDTREHPRSAYPDSDYDPLPYNQQHRPNHGGERYDRRNNSGPTNNYYSGRPREFHRRRVERGEDGTRRTENGGNAVANARPVTTVSNDGSQAKEANKREGNADKGRESDGADAQPSGSLSGDATSAKKEGFKGKPSCPPESGTSTKRQGEETANATSKPEKAIASNKRQSEEVAKPVLNKPESKRYSQQRQRPFPVATAGNVVYVADPGAGAQPEPPTSFYSAGQSGVTGFQNNQSQPKMPQEENVLLPSGQRQPYGRGSPMLPQCNPYPNRFAVPPVQQFQQSSPVVAPQFPGQMGSIRNQPGLPPPRYPNQFPIHPMPNEANARPPLPLPYNTQPGVVPFRPPFKANIPQQRLPVQYPSSSANVDYSPPTPRVQVPSYPQVPASAPPYPKPKDLFQPPGGVTYYNAESQIASRVPPTPREKKTLPIINPVDQSTVDLNVQK